MSGGLAAEEALAPFWFLNAPLDDDELRRQLRLVAGKGIRFVWVHPRRGIEVPGVVPEPPPTRLMMDQVRWDHHFTEQRKGKELPYLDNSWWDHFGVIVEAARESGLHIGIYDELDWPSGTAGMRVTRQRDLCARYLRFRRGRPRVNESVVFQAPGMALTLLETDDYIDVLNPAAVRRFMELTHEEYYRRFREEFGKTLRGFFSDEVGLRHHFLVTKLRWRLIPWSAGLPGAFRCRSGCDLEPRLPDLFVERPGCGRTRRDFWRTVTDLYVSSFHAPILRWCEERGVRYYGHLLCEEPNFLQVACQGDIFRVLRSFSAPGLDHLGLNPGCVHPKIASSVAHHSGCAEVLCESFGAASWRLNLRDLRRISHWLFEGGVTHFVPHAFYYSTEGFRRREYPPSEFFQADYWERYGEFVREVASLSGFLSRGTHAAEAAILYPTESLFAEFDGNLLKGSPTFNDICVLGELLRELGHDYDFLDGEALGAATVQGDRLHLGSESYGTLFLPAARYLPPGAREKISNFARAGGRVVATTRLPDADGENRAWSRELFGIDPARARPRAALPRYLLHQAAYFLGIGLSVRWDLQRPLRLPAPCRAESNGRAAFIRAPLGLGMARSARRVFRGLLPPPPAGVDGGLHVLRRRVGNSDLLFVTNPARRARTFRTTLPARQLDLSTGEAHEVSRGTPVPVPGWGAALFEIRDLPGGVP